MQLTYGIVGREIMQLTVSVRLFWKEDIDAVINKKKVMKINGA